MGSGYRFAVGKIGASLAVATLCPRHRAIAAATCCVPALAPCPCGDRGNRKAEALAAPGVAAIFTAEDVTGDKLNGVPCAWGIVGKDGKPMKEPPHRCWHAAKCAISATRWR